MIAIASQKLRLFYLQDYFSKNTDENHTVTMPELIAYLDTIGIASDRRTLYGDIRQLRSLGMDIEKRQTKTHDYYLATRTFELPELKLLVDAVQSCRFLTLKKSDALIEKLSSLTSRHQADQLARQVYVQNRVKTDNERIYYNVDSIHQAIANATRIGFQYCQYTLTRSLKPRRDGAQYIVSPYLLTWAEDNYYLIADHPQHKGLAHFRVDKMINVEVLDALRDPLSPSFDPAAYAKSMFSMYVGQREWVELQFNESLIGVVMDRFGTDVQVVQSDGNTFVIRVLVSVSPSFFGWLFQFGDQAKILWPSNAVSQMRACLAAAAESYDQPPSN